MHSDLHHIQGGVGPDERVEQERLGLALGWNSLARHCASARKANFGQASMANFALPLTEAVAPVKMTVPLPACSMAGSTCTQK